MSSRIFRFQKSTKTLSARVVLNVILHTSKVNLRRRMINLKMNVHSWVKDKYSHGESKKLTFKENLTKE